MNKVSGTILSILISSNLLTIAEEVTNGTADAQTKSEAQEWKPEKEKPKSSLRDNLFYGGYITLSFGDYSVIGIEPMVGYRVNPKFSAGVKVRYEYIQDDRYNRDRTTSSYGGSVFGRYRVTPKFYLQLEPATYNYELFYSDGSSEREWVPYVFAGGGFRQPLGERSWLYAEIMFDLLMDDQSPYDDWTPFFSIGAGAGF